jgi:hypothetical protein
MVELPKTVYAEIELAFRRAVAAFAGVLHCRAPHTVPANCWQALFCASMVSVFERFSENSPAGDFLRPRRSGPIRLVKD